MELKVTPQEDYSHLTYILGEIKAVKKVKSFTSAPWHYTKPDGPCFPFQALLEPLWDSELWGKINKKQEKREVGQSDGRRLLGGEVRILESWAQFYSLTHRVSVSSSVKWED